MYHIAAREHISLYNCWVMQWVKWYRSVMCCNRTCTCDLLMCAPCLALHVCTLWTVLSMLCCYANSHIRVPHHGTVDLPLDCMGTCDDYLGVPCWREASSSRPMSRTSTRKPVCADHCKAVCAALCCSALWALLSSKCCKACLAQLICDINHGMGGRTVAQHCESLSCTLIELHSLLCV